MSGRSAEVRKLRGELETRFGRAVLPAGAPGLERGSGFLTGIGAIDRLLPGGVPRGALTLWTGGVTSGRTGALRALALRACAEGSRVALVDASRTVDPTFACTEAGPVSGLWVIRPPDAKAGESAAWATESVLRAGVFDLVILDGCLPDATQAQRLRALARERDAALVVTAGDRVTAGNRAWSGARSAAPQGKGNSGELFTSRKGGAGLLFPGEPRARTRFARWNGGRMEEGASSLSLRVDVRLDFRRIEVGQEPGLRPGGRFRRRIGLTLAKGGTGTGAGMGGERELELVHEPADRLRPDLPAPDRSPGGR